MISGATRRPFFRGAAVAIVAVAVFESVCRLAGWLDPCEMTDPYLGFPGTSPLYCESDAQDGVALRRRAPNKPMYRDVAFPARKPPGEFRVFCVGASSVRASAYMDPDGSFPRILEIYLGFLLQGRQPRVINAGGGGMSSIQNLGVVDEVLDYSPDLVVVCAEAGDKNLVPPSPEGVMAQRDEADPVRVALRVLLSRSRLYVAARSMLEAVRADPRAEDAGLSAYSAFFVHTLRRPFCDDTFSYLFEWKQARPPVLMPQAIPQPEIDRAQARFRSNLEAMVLACRERETPVVLVSPIRNLESSIYLRFHVDPATIRDQRVAEWTSRYEAALSAQREGRMADAIAGFRSVRELYLADDDQILALHLGECLRRSGRTQEALAEYERPYRSNETTRGARDVAERLHVPFADPHPLVVRASKTGIPGHEEFTDWVHPTAATNRLIAVAIVETLRRDGVVADLADRETQERAEKFIRAVIESCPDPPHARMMRAIAAGDFETAVTIGRSVAPDVMLGERLIDPLYLGWALMRTGRKDEARELYDGLRRVHWRDLVRPVPDLGTDEAVIKNAFANDVFAWF